MPTSRAPQIPGRNRAAARPALDRGRTLLGPALALIHSGRAPTRSALTSELAVTRATAGAIAAELEALGLVAVDSRPAGSGRGRPSHRLAVAPGGPVVLAAQIHADGFSVALAGLGGTLGEPVDHPLPSPADPEGLLRAVAEAGARLVAASPRRCLGAALAVPTPVTTSDGRAFAAMYLDWPSGTPVRDLFAAAVARAFPSAGFPLPTAVANDANLAALAEHRHGAGCGARHLLYVTSGHRGVGGALVVDGRLHTGSDGLALEVGQLTVDPRGRPCPCGRRGCLDVEADPPALLAAAGITPAPGEPLLERARAVTRAAAHDPAARAAVDRVAERLGAGLAGMVNILNPDRIVLGGIHLDLLTAAPQLLPAVVAERSLWGRSAGVPVLPAALARPDLTGAAELAWQPFLDDPQSAVAG
ncbi:ROK family protein [Peterkaempfera sp. SMS 1(5)a]|uniref:ROK family protein n=1 Tax=Peterkaempfera podocarpi TaxID=3232308 RepID=UPI00366A8EA1